MTRKTPFVSTLIYIVTLLGWPSPQALSTESTASLLLKGCRDNSQEAYYPMSLVAKHIQGRVLVEVERSARGRLRIVKTEESSDPAFSKAVETMLANFRCSRLEKPVVERLSVAFSLTPGEAVPHFDGAQEKLDISRPRLALP